MMNVFAISRDAAHHVQTLYLFTKSDMKTILFPITLFAWCTAPRVSVSSLSRSFFWTWLHLLQFCVSNQSLSPEEDGRNKPWRPIPAGRITVAQATRLRWFLLLLCLTVSLIYGILPIGTMLTLGILLHNELKLDSHWFTRNALNAIGYAVFDAAAAAIAHVDLERDLPPPAFIAYYSSVAIVLTTIHAQDFQDEAGDRLEKRQTIPIIMPQLGRASMLASLTLWSLALCKMCHLSVLNQSALLFMGMLVGIRFYWLRSPSADKNSYRLYNVWLAAARISPLYG